MNTDRYKKAKNTPISPNKQVLAEDFYLITGFVPLKTRHILADKISKIAQYLECGQDCSGRRNVAGGPKNKGKGAKPMGRPKANILYRLQRSNDRSFVDVSLETAAEMTKRDTAYIQQKTCKGRKLYIKTSDENLNPDMFVVTRLTP